MKKIFTKAGIEKLKEELIYLEKIKRKEVADKIKTAAAFGDLKENSAYSDAKDEQTVLETRVAKIRETLKDAEVVDEGSCSLGIVCVGSKVSVEENGNEIIFEVVGETESDPFQGKVSSDSPIGRSLLDKREGDVCLVETPSGEKKYRIKKIF